MGDGGSTRLARSWSPGVGFAYDKMDLNQESVGVNQFLGSARFGFEPDFGSRRRLDRRS